MARTMYDAKSDREQAQFANRERLRAERRLRLKQKRAEVERLAIAFKYCSGDDDESDRIMNDLIAAEDTYTREVLREHELCPQEVDHG